MTSHNQIRVILVDDHRIFLDGLRLLLSFSEEVKVVTVSDKPSEVMVWLQSNSADVLITDLNMPGEGGIEFIKEVKMKYPAMKCVALTMLDDHLTIQESLDAGADAYLLKNTTGPELIIALKHVVEDKIYLSPEINMLLSRRSEKQSNPLKLLTDREFEVLQMIVQGLSSKQIAAELELSIDTIKFHRKNLLSKLDQPNVAALVSFAVKNGLV